MRKLFVLTALLSASAFAQTTILAGSATDTNHTPATTCMFDTNSVATNAPCTYKYTDTTMPISTMLVGYGATPIDYNIPTPISAGACEVVLTFEEPNQTTAGQRLFSVTLPGQAPVTLDLFSLVGLKKLYTLDVKNVPISNSNIGVHLQPIMNSSGGLKNAVVTKLATISCTPPPALSVKCSSPIVCTLDATNTLTVTASSIAGYCGNAALCAFADHEIPTGVIDGTNKVFTILAIPVPNSEQVFLNGVLQKPTSDYTINGNVITFTNAPTVQTPPATIQVNYRAA